ncbi:MAG TPA: phenylalanine--tRNA ligase subunit alpha [Candidatus Saccharimonadales bacterium]|nr:phenylalanine--tRNA ligase subunit alpha [Candidatus Saccharimonadales bacterium]
MSPPAPLEETLDRVREEFARDLAGASSAEAVQELRHRFLGRKAGLLTHALRGLKDLPAELKGPLGKKANALRSEIEASLARAEGRLAAGAEDPPADPSFDPTLPGLTVRTGAVHPVTRVWREIEEIFAGMGWRVEEGPEVETDWYNFEALNIPPDHPARDDQDTFYLEGGGLLRTHTSPIQIRTMLTTRPPLKMCALGKTFRRDSDASHSPVFHQVEGLVVGEGISMADLKGTIRHFMSRVFRRELQVRLRPGYFPFVEPGAEYDISCVVCAGKGCRTCKRTGWIEMGGAGMVHPNVFKVVGYDPERYTGFAFGLGVDRIAMMRYAIDDIRLMFEGDLRFFEQFRSLP